MPGELLRRWVRGALGFHGCFMFLEVTYCLSFFSLASALLWCLTDRRGSGKCEVRGR